MTNDRTHIAIKALAARTTVRALDALPGNGLLLGLLLI